MHGAVPPSVLSRFPAGDALLTVYRTLSKQVAADGLTVELRAYVVGLASSGESLPTVVTLQ
jgi:hypothetical protein